MSEYKPKAGDRVRVTFEGEVSAFNGTYAVVRNDEDRWVSEFKPALVSIEKVEPPVETFKPGDRLRSKDMGFEVTLGSDGYLHHYGEGRVEFHSFPKADSFTSEKYELVER